MVGPLLLPEKWRSRYRPTGFPPWSVHQEPVPVSGRAFLEGEQAMLERRLKALEARLKKLQQ
jgi:hypothetical protein